MSFSDGKTSLHKIKLNKMLNKIIAMHMCLVRRIDLCNATDTIEYGKT